MMRIILSMLMLVLALPGSTAQVRLKSLAHFGGLQENPLTGYGLVIGLAGSGDSRRNKDTTQAISNLLQSFGVTLNTHDISSRNSATVIISANLPAFAHQGDKLDINVASLGDAKSLAGGTLLATPLKGPDNVVYALAQGPVSVGGFKYDTFGNVIQKNHPTTGIVPGGAVIERSLDNRLLDKDASLHLILNHPDFSTAWQAEKILNARFGTHTAFAKSAQDIEIHPPASAQTHLVRFISTIENMTITPDNLPSVVLNERTGIVVAGADVRLEAVTISHGNLQLSIGTRFDVSQPAPFTGTRSRTAVTPAVSMQVKEASAHMVRLKAGATIADLMQALANAHTPVRDTIAILESLKRAGALHAELIIE